MSDTGLESLTPASLGLATTFITAIPSSPIVFQSRHSLDDCDSRIQAKVRSTFRLSLTWGDCPLSILFVADGEMEGHRVGAGF